MTNLELQPIIYTHNLRNRVKHIEQFPDKPIISQNKNLDEYVSAVFDGVSDIDIYVRNTVRPKDGFGPHFDVYNSQNDHLLHRNFPFVATYNIEGRSILQATALSEHLQRDYDISYPEQTKEAHSARRNLGSYALNNPNSLIYTHAGTLSKDSGIIIPQVAGAAYVVHDIIPANRRSVVPNGNYSGTFLKLIAPANNYDARKELVSMGYESLAGRKQSLEIQRQQRELEQNSRPSRFDFDHDFDDEDDYVNGGFISNDLLDEFENPLD